MTKALNLPISPNKWKEVPTPVVSVGDVLLLQGGGECIITSSEIENGMVRMRGIKATPIKDHAGAFLNFEPYTTRATVWIRRADYQTIELHKNGTLHSK